MNWRTSTSSLFAERLLSIINSENNTTYTDENIDTVCFGLKVIEIIITNNSKCYIPYSKLA